MKRIRIYIMKNKLTLLSCTIIVASLTGCGNEDSPFVEGGVSTGSNIISEKNFNIAYDGDFSVIDADGGIDTGVTVGVNFSAADQSGLPVQGTTVYLDVDWGTLSSTTCLLNSSGSCTITWTSNSNNNQAFFPADDSITFTGWAIGEESFSDLNGNKVFDDGDIFLNDSVGPFLDLDHSGDFGAGDKVLTPGNINGQLTAADLLFNGSNCNHSSLCSTTTQIYVSDRDTLSISAAPATP